MAKPKSKSKPAEPRPTAADNAPAPEDKPVASADAQPAASAAQPVASAGQPAASDERSTTDDIDAPLFPAVSSFAAARPKRRDFVIVGVSTVLLGLLMSFHGDVTAPFGNDPAHPLGHYAALLHSGHIPGGVIWGTILTFAIVLGLFGLMGDSPLDLRGDEATLRAEVRKALWQREGFWLVVFCALLYLPTAGAFGLWDPWETHYSEVSREVLARDDWITTWWGQEGWFMSKPVLIFWMSALGMGFGSTFGLQFWRDDGPGAHEWFIRVPIVLFAIAAVYALYKAVSVAWGRRAGLIAGLVLATMPQWFFLTHQAMTDMPFVAPLVIAMAFLMLAVIADPEASVRAYRVKLFGRAYRVSFWHFAVGAVLLVAVPQILYLLTRPMMFGCADDADRTCQAVLHASRIGPFQFPIEQYWYGSAGNSVLRDAAASVPGSPAWEDRYNQIPFFTSFVQGLIWLGVLALLAWSFRRERRWQSLCFAMMYLFGAISFLGKGPAGFGIPEAVLLGFMIVTGRWKILPRIRLLQGIGIYLACGFSWYIAIYCRLGSEFTDEFIVHDLLNRAFAGVHGDTGTFRYFVWQLGYAMFPWSALVPAALVGWKLFIPQNATQAQKDLARLALIWFIVTFTLFSMMITKFHHYIFPAVPAAAILVGLLMHRILGAVRFRSATRTLVLALGTIVSVGVLAVGLGNFFGAVDGRVSHAPPYALPPGHRALGVVLVVLGLGGLVALRVLSRWFAHPAEEPSKPSTESGEVSETLGTSYDRRFGDVALGAVGVAAAVLAMLIGRDIAMVPQSRPAGFERFIHLFTYNYERPFPTHSYDYRAMLTAFGIVAVGAGVLLAIKAVRGDGARVLLALAACFTVWGLDKYMMDLSHHWSQRDLFVRYYSMRHPRENLGYGEDARWDHDPIAAFQMNWKGENFYTGEHAAMLECGLPFCRERTRDWLERHRGERVFFVTEHSRAGSIIGQVRMAVPGAEAHTVTDEFDNNKFVLVEAQL